MIREKLNYIELYLEDFFFLRKLYLEDDYLVFLVFHKIIYKHNMG